MAGETEAAEGRWALLIEEEPLKAASDIYELRAGDVYRVDGSSLIGTYSVPEPGLVDIRLTVPATANRDAYDRRIVATTMQEWQLPSEQQQPRPPITVDTQVLNAEVRGGPRLVYAADDFPDEPVEDEDELVSYRSLHRLASGA